MPQGLSGNSGSILVGGLDANVLNYLESRVTNELLTKYLGSNQVLENLDQLRTDQAVELNVTPLPLPGVGR